MKLTPLSTKIAAWLQRLAADHGGPALISDLTKLSPTIVFGMVDVATIIITGVPTIVWARPRRLDDGARRHVQRRLVDVAGRHH
jgi:hypothetical protein